MSREQLLEHGVMIACGQPTATHPEIKLTRLVNGVFLTRRKTAPLYTGNGYRHWTLKCPFPRCRQIATVTEGTAALLWEFLLDHPELAHLCVGPNRKGFAITLPLLNQMLSRAPMIEKPR